MLFGPYVSTLFPILLLFLLWIIYRPRLVDGVSSGGRLRGFLRLISFLARLGFICFLYFFFMAISAMSTDSCGVSGDCGVLYIFLSLANFWLAISLVVTVISFISDKFKNFKIYSLFLPYFAIPIFIITIMLGMKLQGM
jgi:hypothetical protein